MAEDCKIPEKGYPSLMDKLAKLPIIGINNQGSGTQTPLQKELERTGDQIQFSKYPDGTLRLYKPDSIIADTPAGYSESRVSVKVMVKRSNEEFVVTLNTTRMSLDQPGAEDKLAQAAYNWRRK